MNTCDKFTGLPTRYETSETIVQNIVDFKKSHYIKIKRSKMDISNISNESFEIFAFKAELKLVDLEINKGINDEYWWDFMGVL